MAHAATAPPTDPPSRYKSQRRKHSSAEADGPSSPAWEGENHAVARSRSRYHRKPGTAQSPPDTRPTSAQQQPELPARYLPKHRDSPLKPLYQEQIVSDSHRPYKTISHERRNDARYASPSAAAPGARDLRNISSSDEQDSAADNRRPQTQNDRSSTSRQYREPRSPPAPASPPPELPPPPKSPPAVSHSPPNAMGGLFPSPRLEQQPVRRDGPPQSGQIRATQSTSELPIYQDENSGCFGGLFKRKRGDVPSSTTEAKQQLQHKTAKDVPHTIRPGGGGIVPGIDAPKSAVNAGDRNVIVECGRSKNPFTVKPETTSLDIIKTAATVLAEPVDPKSALLVENFGSVGIERPLRRYESIRDVLNSWDNDRQNVLTLVDPGTGTIEPELTITGVPRERPEGASWHLMASHKPGKWEKRYVTLKPDGQMCYQKDPEKAKDVVNFCHLSDFDIYTPSADRVKKKIKPPKKHCYAIKSQQKTSMFESTQDFVHFFCTGDHATAQHFFHAVQDWRSWYLVHVLGEGRKAKTKQASSSPERKDRHVSSEHDAKCHRAQESMQSHYHLGSFQPLLNMEQFDKQQDSTAQSAHVGAVTDSAAHFGPSGSVNRRSNTVKRSQPTGQLNGNAVLSENERLANLNRSNSTSKRHAKPVLREDEPLVNLNRGSSTSKRHNRPILRDDEPLVNLNRSPSKRRSSLDQSRSPQSAEFKDSALLGQSYSQRRKEQRQRDTQRAFVDGPNLLNGGLNGREEYMDTSEGVQRQRSTRKHTSGGELRRSGSTREQDRNGDLGRTKSQRQKPKPLVDLTPAFKEAPQFKNKGRGYKPDQIGSGGLIDAATSPEDPLNIPQGTVFRNTNSGQYQGSIPPGAPGLIDLTPRHQEPVHHAKKGRGYVPENGHPGGLVMNASTPEDPLGLPQSTVFRSTNAVPERRRCAGSSSDNVPHRQPSTSRSPEAFTGDGLLGSMANRQGWGTESRGRGVIDGSRAGGRPLVDLAADSNYAQGSLLDRVERSQGIPAPVIDRERRDLP